MEELHIISSRARRQKKYIGELKKQGYMTLVCKGWIEARDAILEYLKK